MRGDVRDGLAGCRRAEIARDRDRGLIDSGKKICPLSPISAAHCPAPDFDALELEAHATGGALVQRALNQLPRAGGPSGLEQGGVGSRARLQLGLDLVQARGRDHLHRRQAGETGGEEIDHDGGFDGAVAACVVGDRAHGEDRGRSATTTSQP